MIDTRRLWGIYAGSFRPLRRDWLLACAFLGASSCLGRTEKASGAASTNLGKVGDTIVVRTGRSSTSAFPNTLVPELVVGSGEKAGGEKFGSITAVGVDSKGGTYVFDASVPILRYFAADGKHVHELGREGSGAGEYGKVLLGVAVRKDGRLILGDPINARLTLYGSDGTVAEQWPIDSTVVITSQALTVDTADHTYLKVLSRAPVEGRLWPIKVLHLNDRGILVDAISLPVIAREPTSPGGPFDVAKIWAMSPFAYLVVGINDRYSFDILAPGRAVVRVMHDWEAVRLL